MQKQAKKLALISLLVFQPAQAVLINEICWMGDQESSASEWIELYNPASQAVYLDNWKIIISEKKTINLNGSIPANGFYLLGRNKNQAGLDLLHTKALNNNGESIRLVDQNNNNVDAVDCLEGWSYGSNETKKTMERSLDLKNWQTSLNPGGTPKQKNSLIEKPVRPAVLDNKQIGQKNGFAPWLALFLSLFSGGVIVFAKKLLKP